MKCNLNVRSLWRVALSTIVISASVLPLWSGTVWSQERDASVVLVPLTFEEERWILGPGEVSVLPCEAPSKFIQGTGTDPLIQVLDTKGEPLYQRRMRNPRLILIEDPEEEPPLLSKVSFNVRFALVDGMEAFEFWYEPGKQEEPSVRADLRGAIQEYLGRGGPSQTAPCQQPEYVPDQLGK